MKTPIKYAVGGAMVYVAALFLVNYTGIIALKEFLLLPLDLVFNIVSCAGFGCIGYAIFGAPIIGALIGLSIWKLRGTKK